MIKITNKQLPKLMTITHILRKGEISIAQLQKETGMRRSTLVYYLDILDSGGYLVKERMEKDKTGRPVLLKLNEEKFKQEEQEIREEQKKEEQEMLNHSITQKVLKVVKESSEITTKELFESIPSVSRQTSGAIMFLEGKGYIQQVVKLTDKGKEFLKENDIK